MNNAVTELKGEIAKVDAKLEGCFRAVKARFDAMDAKFDAMDEKFAALAGQFAAQSRYVFLVLALVAALGLYNAVAPHFADRQSVGQPPATAHVPANQGSGQTGKIP